MDDYYLNPYDRKLKIKLGGAFHGQYGGRSITPEGVYSRGGYGGAFRDFGKTVVLGASLQEGASSRANSRVGERSTKPRFNARYKDEAKAIEKAKMEQTDKAVANIMKRARHKEDIVTGEGFKYISN